MAGPSSPDRVLLSFVMPDGTKDQVSLDAAESETHKTSATITRKAVEKGSDITDHVRANPQTVTIEMVITNTPVYTPSTQMRGALGRIAGSKISVGGQQVDIQTFAFDQVFDRVRDAYGALVNACLAGAIFDVFTTLNGYSQMAIEDFSPVRNAVNGGALRGAITFTKLRIVETQTVKTPAGKHKSKKEGKKAPKPETDEEKKKVARSSLKGIVKTVTNAFGGGQ